MDDPLLAEAKVHPVGVFHVESTLVQLGDRVVCIEAGHLLVHLAHHQPGQGHARDAAHQLHRRPVVDVALLHSELFRFGFIVIQEVNLEGAPLDRTGVEVSILDMQVPSAHLRQLASN